MKLKIVIGIIIGLLVIGLIVVVFHKNKNDLSDVYLKITSDGKDLSNTYKKGDSFKCTLSNETFEITIKKITSDKVELQADSYGLFPQRDDGTISLMDKVNTFELNKNKKLVLCLQETDNSSKIEISWE